MINVLDYGIAGDGVANETLKLQELLEQYQGSTIYFPNETIVKVASLRIYSNTTIYLEGNAKLIGSSEYSEYEQWCTTEDYAGKPMHAMIYAKNAKNIKICGTGIIDGNGSEFVMSRERYIYKLDRYPRITQMFFENVDNLLIDEITITNGCYWTIQPVGCRNIKFTRLNIIQDLMMPNCDGIDPDHCQNVIISDCVIESADDCIVLKNTKDFIEYGPTTDVVVTNCILKSTSAALKIGTESFGDFKNICFSNSVIKDSNRGFSIQLRDGGNATNVLVNNLIIDTRRFADIWWGKGEPIAITSFQREPGISELSRVTNVKISNLVLTSESPIYLAGQKSGLINNISLTSIDFTQKQISKWDQYSFDNRPFGGEHQGLIPGQQCGLYAEKIDNLRIRDFQLESTLTDVPYIIKQCQLQDNWYKP